MVKNVIIGILSFICIALIVFSYLNNQKLNTTIHRSGSILADAEEAEKRAIQLAAEAVICQKITKLHGQKIAEMEIKLKQCKGQ